MKLNAPNLRILAIWFVIISIVASAIVVPFFFYLERNRQENITTREYANLLAAESKIRLMLKERMGDMAFLLASPAMLAYKASDNPATLSNVKKLFQGVCHAYGIYDQVSLIAANGNELARVSYEGGRCEAVPESKRENKQDRPYFTEALKLWNGKVYVSPLELNVEQGVIELPRTPTIHFAAPVLSSKGDIKAIVVLNFRANELLSTLFTRLPAAMHTYTQGYGFLTNSQGGISNQRSPRTRNSHSSLTPKVSGLMPITRRSGKPPLQANPSKKHLRAFF